MYLVNGKKGIYLILCIGQVSFIGVSQICCLFTSRFLVRIETLGLYTKRMFNISFKPRKGRIVLTANTYRAAGRGQRLARRPARDM